MLVWNSVMIYQYSPLKVLFDANLRLVWWEWTGEPNAVALEEVFEQLLQISDELQPFRWLADVRNMPAVSPATQQWLSEDWLPRYRKLHIQVLAVLLPAALHNQLVLENLVAAALPMARCDMQYFSDVPAALDWLSLMDEECTARLQQQWLAAV